MGFLTLSLHLPYIFQSVKQSKIIFFLKPFLEEIIPLNGTEEGRHP